MLELRVARRYALALIGIAETPEALDALHADVERVDAVVRASADLRAFLKSPAVNKERKAEILRSVFTNTVGKQMLEFIMLLAEKRREWVLVPFAAQFQKLYDLRMGIVRPRVTSARDLSGDQRAQLERALAGMLRATVRVDYRVDAAILGGLQVQVADTVTDGSVRHMLAQLRKRMHTGTV